MNVQSIDAMKRGREIVCACAPACAIGIGARFARTKRPHMRSRRCAGVCTRESVLNIEPMQKMHKLVYLT